MKEVCILNPLHIMGDKISVSDIDGLKIFKLYEHPDIRPQIEVMKTEVMKYQDLADSIKSFEERKDIKGKDTFDLSDWWKSNYATLPGFTYVLCAVLTNSPNSCPPEERRLAIVFFFFPSRLPREGMCIYAHSRYVRGCVYSTIVSSIMCILAND